MIRVASHSRSPERLVLPEDNLKRIFISSCGYQHFMTKDFSIKRPDGRADYQLLYIYNGFGDFFIDGKWKKIEAGSIVLYHPFEPQIYHYYSGNDSEIYWLHFTGVESISMLHQYQIQNGFVGKDRSIKQLFEEIIFELQLHKPMFQEIAVANFCKILAIMNRRMQSSYEPQLNSDIINKLLARLNKHYMEAWDVSMMANFCHFSPDYFSHQFKKATGVSPIQFLNRLRIEQAKEMLLTGNLTVAEVSELVGYKDPLYFSRIFKKITGFSPKMFHGNLFTEKSNL